MKQGRALILLRKFTIYEGRLTIFWGYDLNVFDDLKDLMIVETLR